MPLTLVLSIGVKSSILEARNLILQSAGYTVVSALSISEAVERFQAGDFDLVILGSFIPAKDREWLACLIRASGSRTPIISVSEKLGQCDAVVNATLEDDPNTFLDRIREVLSRADEVPASWQVISTCKADMLQKERSRRYRVPAMNNNIKKRKPQKQPPALSRARGEEDGHLPLDRLPLQ